MVLIVSYVTHVEFVERQLFSTFPRIVNINYTPLSLMTTLFVYWVRLLLEPVALIHYYHGIVVMFYTFRCLGLMASVEGNDSDDSSGEADTNLSANDRLLKYSRHGAATDVLNLLTSSDDLHNLVNCKGRVRPIIKVLIMWQRKQVISETNCWMCKTTIAKNWTRNIKSESQDCCWVVVEILK